MHLHILHLSVAFRLCSSFAGKKKIEGRKCNEPCLVRFLRHFKPLITRRSLSFRIAKIEDFLLLSLPHLRSSIMSLYISPTMVCSLTLLFYPSSCTRAFTRSCNCRKETSSGARNFHHAVSFSFAIVSRNRGFASKLCVYTSDDRNFRRVKVSLYVSWKERGRERETF